MLAGCASPSASKPLQLITLDPGHFHAALVQKSMYDKVDPVVHVYAPGGDDLAEYLKRVRGYNSRAQNPTRWEQVVYEGPDYLDRMLADRAGNVVVISGNNARKTEYILRSVQAGFHVLADKPMAITAADVQKLNQAFKVASDKGVLVYDIMTERFDATNAIQRELSKNKALFGELVAGSPTEPAIELESVHHFSKVVSGTPLKRPPWFFDVRQEGTAITDVATHLVDLAQGITMGEQLISPADVTVASARRWATHMSLEQFRHVTELTAFPEYLQRDVNAGSLKVYANGEFTYRLRNTWIKIVARWDYEAKAGGDRHTSVVRGSKATLDVRQGAEEAYRPVLYIQKATGTLDDVAFGAAVNAAVVQLQPAFPGIVCAKDGDAWRINIPDALAIGHEAHFAQVMRQFLGFVEQGRIPAWETSGMLTKYTTLLRADELSRK